MIHFKTHISKIDWTIECFVTTDNSQLEEIIFKQFNEALVLSLHPETVFQLSFLTGDRIA